MKKAALFLALALFAASVSFAAEGKIKSVSDDKIAVEMADAAKLKKGSSVKLNGKVGKISSIEGSTVTIKTCKASEFKAGETVKVDKMSDMQGC